MANSSLDSGRPSSQPINGGRFRISLMILLASRTATDPLCASTWGAGLYRCGECGEPVRTRARYYSCKAGHLNRTRDAIDEFVRTLIVARLQKKDLKRRNKQADPEIKDAISERIAQQRARIARAERDYDAEVIEGQTLPVSETLRGLKSPV